ncbi:uncharacterized protein EHS24_005372 [Apiotrichum porosum]|uniref:alpha-galactosidase n=1 Tax=Apiotrichum porosum TaxID=105984 RepID=A0A427XDJ8_9TREE|nr:uncharacterized protein EHS24_005372 [Apiotrichum porosum]RSH76794.1 hypothetical protein EHS24_005372 [Apiotrichum porosum]
MTDWRQGFKGTDVNTESRVQNRKPRLLKMLVIVGLLLLCVIPLTVGLGVGLAKRHSHRSTPETPHDSEALGRPSLWAPQVGVSWQIVLSQSVKVDAGSTMITPNVDVYVLDLFDTKRETIDRLRRVGKNVVCYFSAGSWEDWREDASDYHTADLGNNLDGWAGERWVNVSAESVRSVMRNRIKLAAEKGCDGIDPDNVDGYENNNGLRLSSQDAVNFVKFLADEARKYNIATGLKNAGYIIHKVLDSVHFSVNEQCVEFSECKTFAPFIKAGKPVFHIEYPEGAPSVSSSERTQICSATGAATGTDKFSTVLKKMNLDGWVQYCTGQSVTTPTA